MQLLVIIDLSDYTILSLPLNENEQVRIHNARHFVAPVNDGRRTVMRKVNNRGHGDEDDGKVSLFNSCWQMKKRSFIAMKQTISAGTASERGRKWGGGSNLYE